MTGLRYAEVLGLTVDDIDFKHKLISVNKTWDYKYHTGFKTTKNASSVRTVDVDKSTLVVIKQVIRQRRFKSHDRICIDLQGKLPVSATINRYLENLCYQLNISPISFHRLRHTHASILLFKGVNILSVSRRLGHHNAKRLSPCDKRNGRTRNKTDYENHEYGISRLVSLYKS
ncbi:site-specific integrase [Latilactobacillus sakei]|uniref:site-specific integrase n=1 Tax=Latilactobacillus sakei TaxID=1599 RepID=UPI000AF15A48